MSLYRMSITADMERGESGRAPITVGAKIRITSHPWNSSPRDSGWGTDVSVRYDVDPDSVDDCDYIKLYAVLDPGYIYSAMTWELYNDTGWPIDQYPVYDYPEAATIPQSTVCRSGMSAFHATLVIRGLVQTWTVTYNANGGTGAPETGTTDENGQLTISPTIPTRAGFTFLYWNGNSSGTGGTNYYPGQTYTFSASTTLFAIWTPAIYTITYNANGGTGAPAAGSKTYGQTYYIASGTPSRPLFHFAGWSTSATATAPQYVAGNPYTTDANLYLYAVWIPYATYTVYFNANSGSGAPSAQTKTQGIPLTLSASVPTRDGYFFTLWNTSQDGSGQSYAPGATYTTDASITLYAQWETSGSKNVYVWKDGEWVS